MIKNTVLLLKAQQDKTCLYKALLEANNFQVKTVKTLDFQYENLDLLRQELLENHSVYNGIIFSSPRCVEAVNRALNINNVDENWNAKSNYVVGEATKEAAEKLGFKCEGESTGNAVSLAKFIMDKHRQENCTFLFPHGNLKTDTLNKEFSHKSSNIKLKNVLVYETISNPDIEKDLDIITNGFNEIPEYLVFFSPSGVKTCMKYLQNIPNFNSSKIIAIGPVTENALKEENLNIYGVAKNPTPKDVLEVILQK